MAKVEPIVKAKLLAAIKEQGTRKAAADQLKMSHQYLTDILLGRRSVSAKVAKKLGLRWVLVEIGKAAQ